MDDDEDDERSVGYPAPWVSAYGEGERAYWDAIESAESEEE